MGITKNLFTKKANTAFREAKSTWRGKLQMIRSSKYLHAAHGGLLTDTLRLITIRHDNTEIGTDQRLFFEYLSNERKRAESGAAQRGRATHVARNTRI